MPTWRKWPSTSGGGLRIDTAVATTLSHALQLIRGRVPCSDPIGQSMLHPDASGMKHGTR